MDNNIKPKDIIKTLNEIAEIEPEAVKELLVIALDVDKELKEKGFSVWEYLTGDKERKVYQISPLHIINDIVKKNTEYEGIVLNYDSNYKNLNFRLMEKEDKNGK